MNTSENQKYDKPDEMVIARKIQCAMIPKTFPLVEEVDIASLYIPSEKIGGDIFDVVQLNKDIFAFFILDVASHGISAALISSLAKVLFLNHIRLVNSPRVVVERVNKEILENISNGYYHITAFLGYLDLHDNKLTYCNSGHPYPIVFRGKQQKLEHLKSNSCCLGLFENTSFEEDRIYLNSGDWLLLFSDGFYKFFNGSNELECRKNLEKYICINAPKTSAKELIKKIQDTNSQLQSTTKSFDDDISLIAFSFLTQSRKNQLKEKLGFNVDDPVYLQFISYFEEMDRATAVILSSMDSLGYPDESIRKMKIILTELFANAIYHGNKGDHSKKVIVGHTIDKNKVVISIMDEGDGFDPSSVPDPTLPENLIRDCGRGIYIVKSYADKLEFNEKGNRVTITKYHVTK